MVDPNDLSTTVLKARIALLATAIGGPDYTSNLDPPPYKLGDDCLACLKDLKRWFRLVDENQNRWDVAIAAAEYRILQDDLIPILIDWENKCSLAHKLNKDSYNKEYHDNIALLCVQLIVIMTCPQVLTDQSTARQVAVYSELKKRQLEYKRDILMAERGKVLRAIVRLASKVIKIDRIDRTPRDNVVLRLIINLFRNVVAIEPGELNITKKKQISTKGINSVDTLPPGVSMDDISLNTVIAAFQKNKVLGLVLTLASSMSVEFEQDFINTPLMELMFYLTKDIPPESLVGSDKRQESHNDSDRVSSTGAELLNLLDKENNLKKNVIKNTSTRHSRFGALLSIQTPDSGRLTVSGGGQNLLDDSTALNKLDSRKKWNKRSVQHRDDIVAEGLPNSLLNSGTKSGFSLDSTMMKFAHFIDDFIDSSFNTLLHSVTNQYTGDQDQMTTLEKTEYLLFFSWFVKYQREKCNKDLAADISSVDSALQETSFILVSTILRTGYELKNWAAVHAGMIAFNELLLLISSIQDPYNSDEVEFIVGKLFSDDRIQLLTSLPKTAFRYSLQYMKSCVELVHTVLETLEQYTKDNSLTVTRKTKSTKRKEITEEQVTVLMDSQGIGRDEALDLLNPSFKKMEFNFMKVLKKFCVESIVDTYINYLQRFRELNDTEIKKAIYFLHRVFVQASEQSILFRLDLIMLLKDMLAPDGVSRKSRVRKHIEQFSNYFLYKLKKRLKSSPSWYIGLLFPLLYGSEVGYFQKYGEVKPHKENNYHAVPPSRFKNIEDEEQLPESVLKDMKFGILVSTLIDDGKEELLISLISHMQVALDRFKSWLSVNVQHERETENSPDEILGSENFNGSKPFIFDKDFRTLLDLIGYSLPLNVEEQCKLPGNVEIDSLQDSLELVKKHLATPFQTPNGLPSSSYLLRPKLNASGSNAEDDGWHGDDEYDYEEPGIVPDGQQLFVTDDDAYFEELEKDMGDKLSGKETDKDKGIAKSKKKPKAKTKRSRKQKDNSSLPLHDIGEQPEKTKQRKDVLSKDFISDSEEEEDNINPLFFENEMYMRWLLDKHRGQLPEERYALFGKFSAERIANNGSLVNDYSALFGGAVPDLEDLRSSETTSDSPDRTLISLSRRVAAEIEKASEEPEPQNTHETDLSDSEVSMDDFPVSTSNADARTSPLTKRPTTDLSSSEDDNSTGHANLSRKKRKVLFADDEDDD
ncbi:hypothetical protein ZYGR_0W00240 [Zygosaccharomyces rouxii]|uniref:Topoisomerase 1-associated factor 1 n=2 Tax=Zygosaccharomyces rouxii TaxID=4956 RepID=C5DYY5_ZYGRC|nr:uncharacterized protein ZYRO0F16742g [Zygosaccharomyces rouxii]KAH9201292.1 topoisomerase 1-associated factor 1 [Zygosaccharomyces rouxii]GAV50498.1 hypothetical protein ZYGR_0W00240 [Zygosaccharomyces rouxii]CAQ43378.1 Topoisomerase 1-associated factor 1 [Zygosaccharomyces rouxii]CAR28996.1 ZYRO0F16742p [Zygosaccharomyces rouxii]